MKVELVEEKHVKENMANESKEMENTVAAMSYNSGCEYIHEEENERKKADIGKKDEEVITNLEVEEGDSDDDSYSVSSVSEMSTEDGEHTSTSGTDNEEKTKEHLTDGEIEEILAEFLEVESKAAEAQESLEEESLVKVESEVRSELAEKLQGDELEQAIKDEMKIFKEEWQSVLDDIENQSSVLLEQLDGAGIELPSLYKWIENQVPYVCCTEAWKKRAHWVGSLVSGEVNDSVREAEKYLQNRHPVRRKHGRLLETGASGFLARNLSVEHEDGQEENPEKGWDSFGQFLHSGQCSESNSFGSKNWAAVYLASTPQEAAKLGLKLPGVDEVEEIDDLQGNPLFEEAIRNEKELGLSEEQVKHYKKVREEDDIKITRKLQFRLEQKRKRNRKFQGVIEKDVLDALPSSSRNGELDNTHSENSKHTVGTSNKINGDSTANDKRKRPWEKSDAEEDSKRVRTVIIVDDNNDEKMVGDNIAPDDLFKDQGSPVPVKKDVDIIDVDILPSPVSNIHTYGIGNHSKCFYCTVCSGVLKASEVHSHPIMKVIICGDCRFLLVEKMRIEDSNCNPYCRWCTKCDDLLNCSSCKELFCAGCILRNFSESYLSKVKTKGWECFCCSPHLLRHFVRLFEKASGNVTVASSGSESEHSDGVDARTSNKRRGKRRIRRILDDAELGEETKQKIAIEQARQEHLKSMQSHSASRMCTDERITNPSVAEVPVSDATEGYIVNVAREDGEEPVRIPLSISTMLKPHQVAGIRFMWENIIQSIKKAKSGDNGLGCILAHSMGLGKTLQVIALLYTAMRGVDLGLKTALIVTPKNVLYNWRQEFAKWKPKELKPLRVLMLEDVSRDKRAELLSKWRVKGGVLLIGYASFLKLSLGRNAKDRNTVEICQSLHYGPDILICDEAHIIKNRKADTTLALRQVKTQRRVALTGSPLQNNLMEYYCMVDFVREGYLGSSHEFRNRFQNPIENGQHTNSTSVDVKIMNQRSHILYEQLKGFVQRMDPSVVKEDLPSKKVFVITVNLSPLQRKLYRSCLDAHGFTHGKASSEKTFRKKCFFAAYQALAQIWNHPGLLQLAKDRKDCPRKEDVENFLSEDSSSDDNLEHDLTNGERQRHAKDILQKKIDAPFDNAETDWWKKFLDEAIYKEVDYSGKMVLLLDILTMSSEIGDKTLVFSQSLTTLDLIEHYLSKLPRKDSNGKCWKQGKDWYRLDGSTPGLERQKLVERFNETSNERVKCTLISTRAGSLGINLYAANRVIIFDGSWNPTNDLQAIYRSWRYGQKKPVFAYRLLAHGTMEEKIYKRQVTKEGLSARVVDRQQIHRTMSKEEMLHLFDFGDYEKIELVAPNGEDNTSSTGKDVQAGDTIEKLLFSLSNGNTCLDNVIITLLGRHYPHWIANCHEHETLLQENESERLSKEEQDLAWQNYQKSMEWEEVQRVVYDDSEMKSNTKDITPERTVPQQTKSTKPRVTNQRKCTNLAHMLTLRSKQIKSGGSTTCGECSEEIRWETLNRDGKSK